MAVTLLAQACPAAVSKRIYILLKGLGEEAFPGPRPADLSLDLSTAISAQSLASGHPPKGHPAVAPTPSPTAPSSGFSKPLVTFMLHHWFIPAGLPGTRITESYGCLWQELQGRGFLADSSPASTGMRGCRDLLKSPSLLLPVSGGISDAAA